MLDDILRLLTDHLFLVFGPCCIICISLRDHLLSEEVMHTNTFVKAWRYSRMENSDYSTLAGNTLLIAMYTIFHHIL